MLGLLQDTYWLHVWLLLLLLAKLFNYSFDCSARRIRFHSLRCYKTPSRSLFLSPVDTS